MPLDFNIGNLGSFLNGAGANGGLPPVKANMAPPENFWEGNNFRIGAPGLQATPVSDPSHPASPNQPAPPPPTPTGPPPTPTPRPAIQPGIQPTPQPRVQPPPSWTGGLMSRIPQAYRDSYEAPDALSPPPSGLTQTPAPSFPSVGGGAGGSARNPFVTYMGPPDGLNPFMQGIR